MATTENHDAHAQAAQEAQQTVVENIAMALREALSKIGPAPKQDPTLELYLGREKIYPPKEGQEPDPEKMAKFSAVLHDSSLKGSARILARDEHGARENIFQMTRGEVKVDKYNLVEILGLVQDVKANQDQAQGESQSVAESPSSEIEQLRAQVEALTAEVANIRAQVDQLNARVIPILDNPKFRDWAATTTEKVQEKTKTALNRLGNFAKNTYNKALDVGIPKEIEFVASQLTDKYGAQLQDGSKVYATEKYTYQKEATGAVSITAPDRGVLLAGGKLTPAATEDDVKQLRAIASALQLIAPKPTSAPVVNQIQSAAELPTQAPMAEVTLPKVVPVVQIQVAEAGQDLSDLLENEQAETLTQEPSTLVEQVHSKNEQINRLILNGEPKDSSLVLDLRAEVDALSAKPEVVAPETQHLPPHEQSSIQKAAQALVNRFGSESPDGSRVLAATQFDYRLTADGNVSIQRKDGDVVFDAGKTTSLTTQQDAKLLREIPAKVAAVQKTEQLKAQVKAEAKTQTTQEKAKVPALRR